MKTVEELLKLFPNNMTILDAAIKTEQHLGDHDKVVVSISGGSDSDIMMDLVERIGYNPGQVIYVWFNTGLEYEATKCHLDYLRGKYGVQIIEMRAQKPIPISCRQYGQPFLSKLVSLYIHRLQIHGFTWEDRPYEELIQQFPKCQSALKWWCNAWGEKSRFNIERNFALKEFMLENPPSFKISDKCCTYAKKATAKVAETETGADLSIVGVRQAENGIRSQSLHSCFTPPGGLCVAQFRPLFWMTDADKREYEAACGVQHSDCYTRYGLTRTGCAGCPFGSGFEDELEIIRRNEPKLFTAVNKIFGASYEYTRKYREFKEKMKGKIQER